MTEESDILKNADGSWKYTNALIHAVSPYLLQHAHNPVDWYAWDEEVFALAKKQGKPIFLSVGYATCYWCHVMERQIFNNPLLAALMNRYFINIKVDREERPDIDEIYMTARQVLTQEGGWPNNVFLTPDLQPFFAGGTFTSESYSGKEGFSGVMDLVRDAWENRQSDVIRTAGLITKKVRYYLEHENVLPDAAQAPAEPDLKILVPLLLSQLSMYYDEKHGGFFQAPKFPHESYLLFLLGYYGRTGNEDTRKMAFYSLNKMAEGGIFDHVGGGFHRYAVDNTWHVPHFEKMLYNQANLIRCYAKAFQLERGPIYQYIAEKTLAFVCREMQREDGAFLSAIDAETDAVEGEYYAWSKEEVCQVLSPEEQTLFFEHFSLADIPVIKGHKHAGGGIIYARRSLEALNTEVVVAPLMAKLYGVRLKRKRPATDDKVITAWNGLMITACAEAGTAFGNPVYIKAAEKAAEFIMGQMFIGHTLMRVARQKKIVVEGFLEDYAFFLQGLIALHKATKKKKWLAYAIKIAHQCDKRFFDPVRGGYFFAPLRDDNIVRIKMASDSAIMSDNATMMHNLGALASFTGEEEWKKRARMVMQFFYPLVIKTPISYLHLIEGYMAMEPEVNEDHHTLGIAANDNDVVSTDYLTIALRTTEQVIPRQKPFTVEIDIVIKKGWHIHTNPAPLAFLQPTRIDFRGNPDIEVRQIVYPEGVPMVTHLPGSTLTQAIPVYEHKVTVYALLAAKKGVTLPSHIQLTVLVSAQVCNQATCLPPSDVVVKKYVEVEG